MMAGRGLSRGLLMIIGAGVLVLLLAFVPSPLGLLGAFDAPATVTVRRPPPLALPAMPPLSEFAAITARPLFNEGRKPDPATGAVGNASVGSSADQGELSEYRLVGIVADRATQRAILERSGAPSLKVGPGDRLAGWRIDKIDSSGIVASKDERSVRIAIPKTRPRPAAP